VKNKNLLCTKYLNYALKKIIKKYVNFGMGNPKLMSNVVSDIPIPIPPIKTQQHIVDILDKFDALTSDLQIGLPAEITARKKQYEYYRNRLLTFKEVN
jgi:type I restriction enzyme S subunit